MRIIVIFFLNLILLSSCANQEHVIPHHTEQIFWVNSSQIDCVGVAPMKCLQVKRGDSFEEGDWEAFYSSIQGFDYQKGYLYKLKVEVTELRSDQTPADTSSLSYRLISIMSKYTDKSLQLNDKWLLEAINNQYVALQPHQIKPQLEINVESMNARGTDGCNQFFGQISTLNARQLVFGATASTKKYCGNMHIPGEFHAAMSQVAKYEFSDLYLMLLNDDGTEVLRFKKVD